MNTKKCNITCAEQGINLKHNNEMKMKNITNVVFCYKRLTICYTKLTICYYILKICSNK